MIGDSSERFRNTADLFRRVVRFVGAVLEPALLMALGLLALLFSIASAGRRRSATRAIGKGLAPLGRAAAFVVPLETSSALSAAGLLGVLAIAFALKLPNVQQNLSLGIDPSNYLVTMNAFFGNDPTGLGLARPPLIAVPMKIFTSAFGVTAGIQVLGAFAAVSIGVPFFLLAQRVMGRYVAMLVTLIFVFSSGYSSMIAWGFLSFFGIFFITLTAYLLLTLVENPTKRNALATGASASLLVGFHQVSTIQFILFALPFVGLVGLLHRQHLIAAMRSLILAVLTGGALALLYAPSYLLALREGAGNNATDGALFRIVSPSEAIQYLSIFYPNPELAIPLGAVALVGLALLWRRQPLAALMLAVFGVVSVSAATISIGSPGFTTVVRRLPYLSYIPFWILVGTAVSATLGVHDWSNASKEWQAGIPGGALTVLVAVSAAIGITFGQVIPDSQARMVSAANYYNYLDPSLWDTVQWIKNNTPGNAIIAAHPKTLGWWIEGGAERNAYETRDAASFYKIQMQQAQIADLIFSRNQGLTNGLIRAAITDPYPSAAGGDPMLGVMEAGQYQDVAMFHNHEITLHTANKDIRLDSMPGKTQVAESPNGEKTFVSVYEADSVTITRTISLSDNRPDAVVSYAIHDSGDVAKSLEVNLNVSMGLAPKVQQIDSQTFSKQQSVHSFLGLGPIVTNMHVDAIGASVAFTPSNQWDNVMIAQANINSPDSVVTFNMSVVSPQPTESMHTDYYNVPDLLRDNNIGYVAIDTKISSPLFNDLSWRSVWWLDEAPYLKLVHQDGDVKVYKVDLSAVQPTDQTTIVNLNGYVDTPLSAALTWLNTNAPADSNVVTYPNLLGWWVDQKSKNQLHVQNDLADFVFSRNQGLTNSLFRAAVTDPYNSDAGGDPTIGVYAAGEYQNVALLHNHDVVVKTKTGWVRLDSLNSLSRVLIGADGRPYMETTYASQGFGIKRTVRLDSSAPDATVAYSIADPNHVIKSFAVSLNLATASGVELDQTTPTQLIKNQPVRSATGIPPIVTDITLGGTNADVAMTASSQWPDIMDINATLTGVDSTILLTFSVPAGGDTIDLAADSFYVPQLLLDRHIDYLVVDGKTNNSMINDISWRTVWWLDQAPYLQQVFQQDDVKIYKVNLTE